MPFSQQTSGLIYGLTAYLLWGTFPIFFSWLSHMSPFEVITHRILWSFVFVSLLLIIFKRLPQLQSALKEPGVLKSYLLSSILIAINWLAFIWAVADGNILASSLGYFMTPLVSVMLARVFLKERLNRYRSAACLLAFAAVAWQALSHGELPVISLILALSFGFYGLVRKQQKADALTGLAIETSILLPFAIFYVAQLGFTHTGNFIFEGVDDTVLLMLSGVVTALPLLAFAAGAKKLPLSTIGFLMYINPTMQFLVAVFMFDEPFDHNTMITFMLIWLALGLFTWGSIRKDNLDVSIENLNDPAKPIAKDIT